MKRILAGIVLLALASSSANAALQSRLSGRAYYDTLLDITWLADGNLVVTQPFGVTDLHESTSGFGAMNWDTAQEWIAGMNAANYLGVNNWRLPRVVDTGAPGCNLAYSGTDCGWNVDPATGEIAHLYFVTLGNIAGFDSNGVHQECDTGMPAPPACLTNVGPFTNFFPDHYWTDTAFFADNINAWEFDARNGVQDIQARSRYDYVWAVRDGDIGPGTDTDTDSDGVINVVDNCSLVANPTQVDSDQDGFGNRCDADLTNNGFTNAQDYMVLRAQFGHPSVAPTYNKADFNANGLVNSQDYILFRGLLGSPPGPSGLACAGTVPCP